MDPFQGAIGAGPIEGGITYQTDQGECPTWWKI